MSYAVTASFDIKDGEDEDYKCVGEMLETLGLSKTVEGQKKTHTLPSTTYYGKVSGADASKVSEAIAAKVENSFLQCGVSGKVFIAVGGEDHSWSIRYPKGA